MSVEPCDRPEYADLVKEYLTLEPGCLIAEIVELDRLLRDEAVGAVPELPYHQYSEVIDRLWVASWAARVRGVYRLVRSA